jgi:hypothetical protein
MEQEPKKFEIHKSPEDRKKDLFDKLEEAYAELDHGSLGLDREKRDILKNKIKEVMAEL